MVFRFEKKNCICGSKDKKYKINFTNWMEKMWECEMGSLLVCEKEIHLDLMLVYEMD